MPFFHFLEKYISRHCGDEVLEKLSPSGIEKILICSFTSSNSFVIDRFLLLIKKKFPGALVHLVIKDNKKITEAKVTNIPERTGRFRFLRTIFKIAKGFRKEKFDLVVSLDYHTLSLSNFFISFLLSKALTTSIIVYSHEYTFLDAKRLFLAYFLGKWESFTRWVRINVSYGVAPFLRFFISFLEIGTVNRKQDSTTKRFLIFMRNGIGDILISIPAVRALRKGRPNAYIACLVPEKGTEIMSVCPYTNDVIAYSLQNSLLKYFALLLKLRNLHFDTALMLMYISYVRYQLLPYIADIPQRVCLGMRGSWIQNFLPILTQQCPLTSFHAVEIGIDIVKSMGIQQAEKKLEIWIPDKDRDFIKKYLWDKEVKDTDLLIGIHPGAGWEEKRWSEINFAKVGDILSERYEAKIVITGGSSEIKLGRKIAKLMKSNPVVTAGELTLLQLAALIERCNLFITNDTGPMHMTVAMRTPLVALFGSTYPQIWGYLEHENSFVLRKKELICGQRANCEAYKNYKVNYSVNKLCSSIDSTCINSISISEVIDAAEELLIPESTSFLSEK